MNVDQIRTFHKVAAAGSFTKAARELFLTQSAVSQQRFALTTSDFILLFFLRFIFAFPHQSPPVGLKKATEL